MSGIFAVYTKNKLLEEKIYNHLLQYKNSREYKIEITSYRNNLIFGSININNHTAILNISSDSSDLFCIGSIFNKNDILDTIKKQKLQFDKIADISALRGSFVGLLRMNMGQFVDVFVDQTASKPLFYYYDYHCIIIASSLQFISKIKNSIGKQNSANLNAYYSMLSFGYMLNDDTYVSDIKKLFPGTYIEIDEKSFSIKVKTYYNLSTNPKIQGKTDELIEELAVRYRDTLNLIFSYDMQFNKPHCILLSGGLDSRIIVGFAHQLGFTNISAINFAQSFSQDNESAQQIAEKLKIDFIFNSLNYGNYLIRSIDDVIKANDGLIFFSGAAHLYDTLKKLNVEQFGLIHTGMLIDGILGGYMDTSSNKNWYQAWGESSKLIDKIDSIDLYISACKGKEEFNCINRGINAISNGYRMIERFTEFSSPACDWHLVDFGFRLPDQVKYRKGIHEILKYDLVIRFLPELRWILYHNNLSPVVENKFVIALFHLLNNIKRVITNKMYFSQNPFKKWFKTNDRVLATLNNLFSSHIDVIQNKELNSDIRRHFNNGNFTEKVECITVLKATELHNVLV